MKQYGSFEYMRLIVIGFGLGILSMATAMLWDIMLIPAKILALGLLAFTLYHCWLFTPTSHSEHTNNE
jgi:hypothetical protein